MNTKTIYSRKVEKYAKYRWDYAASAIEKMMETTGMSSETIIADIGAGPGNLTKHLVGRAKKIFAIEPNAELRLILVENWENSPLPDEDHPLFGTLEMNAREIFARYTEGGLLKVDSETELILGMPVKLIKIQE